MKEQSPAMTMGRKSRVNDQPMINSIGFALILCALLLVPAIAGENGEGSAVLQPNVARYDFDAIPKDPMASMALSATLPGTGQIYNKEYLRGILTGIGFYAGVALFQYMYSEFELYNRDTVYFNETNKSGSPTPFVQTMYVPKPDSMWKWPSARDKAIAISSIGVAICCYVWGIYDSYNGAKRYNKKLITSKQQRYNIALSYSSQTDKTTLSAIYRF